MADKNTLYIHLRGYIKPQIASVFIQTIQNLLSSSPSTQELIILFSSTGGIVFAGLEIYNFLRSLPLKKITIYNYGIVHSVATLIYCAGTNRITAPKSTFFIHGVSFGGEGKFSFDERALKERLEGLEKDGELILSVLADNTNISKTKIKKWIMKGTTLNAQEALKIGLAHKIEKLTIPAGVNIPIIQG